MWKPYQAALACFILAVVSVLSFTQPTNSALTDSAPVTVTAASQTWIVPSLTLTPINYRSATASWPALSGYSSYTLQWSTSSSFASPQSATVSASSYVVNGLSALTTYYFRVQAVGAPTSGWSSPTNMRTTAVTVLKSMFYQVRSWPSSSAIDSKGNVWITGYIDNIARIISPDGTSKDVGVYDDSVPLGITLVNDNLALVPRDYKDPARVGEVGIYSISSTGAYTRVSNISVYGLVYDSKRNVVYVTRGGSLQQCNYTTWACTTIASQTGSNFGYVSLTPSKDKIVIANRDNGILSIYDIPTATYTTIDATTGLDVRGVTAIGESDFVAGSVLTGDVWRIKTNAAGTALVSKQTIATGIAYPLMMSFDPTTRIFYMGGTIDDTKGVYKYENLLP